MSVTAARRWLWVALVGACPVPIALLGPGWVPPAQLAQLGLAAFAFGLAESLRGVVGWTAVIFLAQALVWALAFWLAARSAAPLLARARGGAIALAALLLVAACIVPIYRTPYHATLARATLLEVYW